MIMVAENQLQQAGWYHGPMMRQQAEQRLTSEGTRPGDFLVRESASVDGYIALSIKAKQRVVHFLINEKYGRFYIGDEPTTENRNVYYATIQNLITENKAKYNLRRAMIVPTFQGTTCPGCAANISEDDEFCDECGMRLKSTKEQIEVYEDADAEEGGNEDEDATYEDEFDARAEAQHPSASQNVCVPVSQNVPQASVVAAAATAPYSQTSSSSAFLTQPQTGVPVYSAATAAPVAKFCGGCGAKRNADEKFCGQCGQKLA